MKDKKSILPDFLYEDEGFVKVGVYADADVTTEWNRYIGGLQSEKTALKQENEALKKRVDELINSFDIGYKQGSEDAANDILSNI